LKNNDLTADCRTSEYTLTRGQALLACPVFWMKSDVFDSGGNREKKLPGCNGGPEKLN